MKRRQLLKRVGTASVATLGVAGTASAAANPAAEIDRELDVADVSGVVSLDTILSEEDMAYVPAGLDPSSVEIAVAEEAETISPSRCCCCECTSKCVYECQEGDCCYC